MNPDIFGKAIKDYYENTRDQKVTVISPDFDDDYIPVKHLFRSYSEMPSLEKKGLDFCNGLVLDIGCGAGSHSLYLKENTNCKVYGIDISPGAIEVASQRGLNHVLAADFYKYNYQQFDTLLLLMNGAGIIGTLSNIDSFLTHAKNLMLPGGQILLDSSDISYLFTDKDGGFRINMSDRYYGELQYKIAYKNQESSWFDWLFIDYITLKNAANTNGLHCELLYEGEHYDYLARLTFAK